MTYIKRFGIHKLYSGRYAIVTGISEDRRTFHTHQSLNYANADFAIKKAAGFARRCFEPFVNSQGEAVDFQFVNMGII